MSVSSKTRGANWWGLASTIGLFMWLIFCGKAGPQAFVEKVLCWGSLVLVHIVGIKAATQRFGWVYLIPLVGLWVLALIGNS